MNIERLIKPRVREIPDWPKSGINFKDITPLLEDKEVFSKMIDELCKPYLNKKIDKIVGIDARGFLLASAMAYKLKTGIAIVRKQGKLPSKTISKKYALEYGSNTIEMHEDSILSGEKVLIVDDVLATGGTMKAAIDLVKEQKGKIIGVDFLIELAYLNGRKQLLGQKIRSLIKYNSAGKIKPQKKLAEIGIIGGSGLDDLNILKNVKDLEVKTQYGPPSSSLKIGEINGQRVALIARHGRRHTIPPTQVNFRANIQAFKDLGVRHILASTACGSLRKEIKRGDIIILDQFIDFTRHRKVTYYEEFLGGAENAKHIAMPDPFSKELRQLLIETAKELKLKFHPRGTAITIEGPRFSTRAESKMFRIWGADVINMSIAPECILANEAGIQYAAIAMSTDYDSWAEEEESVTWNEILKIFGKNVENVKKLFFQTIPKIK